MFDIGKDQSFASRGIPRGILEVNYPAEGCGRAALHALVERELAALRERYADYDRKAVFGENPYFRFFRKFKKTYPVMQQFETVMFKGRPFPEEDPVTAVPFLLFSGILLAIGLIYFLSSKTQWKKCLVSLVLFAACAVFGNSGSFAFWANDLTYEGESVYNYLQVTENERHVSLSTNVLFGVQSVRMKSDNLTGMYYDYALAAPVMAGLDQSNPGRILILGNGTGTFATQCTRYFPGSKISGVENDDKITDLAKTYFALPETVDVTTYDGRAYLQAIEGEYDVIQVDAYQDITIPFQMSSTEFFTLVKEHLAPGGVMVVNLNMHSDGEGSINQALCDTIASLFPHVYTVDVPGATNRELFASMDGDPLRTLAQEKGSVTASDLRTQLDKVQDGLRHYVGGERILTDDQAPVEVLGMRAIDGLIQAELQYYQKIYREEGLKGLLAQF